MKKWFIGLTCVGMLATAAMGTLTTPATLPMEYAGESGWTTASLDALTGWDATGLGTVYAAPNASCKLDSADDNIIIYFDSAPGEIVYSARRSNATAPTNTFEAKLQESVDNSTWTDVQTFDGSELTGTLVTFTNALSSSSRYVKFIYTVKAGGQNFGIGYVKITTGGPAVFSVSFDPPDGLQVDQGSTEAIRASAANGTGPYTYAWSSTLGASYYTGIDTEFTILATAPIGSYSASVVASDSASAKVTNSMNFSVVAPVEKYAIAIVTNAPANGTVTTTPATEAAAGATVTINATPTSGYAVDTYNVVGADTTVVGTTASFTMPAQAVTVTVTFAVEEVPPEGSYIVDFEGEGETKTAYASATISLNGKDWDMTDALVGTTAGADWFNGTRSARMRGYGTSAMTLLEDLPSGLGTISFDYRRYGTASQVDWRVEYSTDAGGSWTQIGSDFTAPASDVVQTFSETVNASGNVRVRIKSATETGTANHQLNIDDITMTSGGPTVFGVSFDKTSGFTVETGSSATITATAANGTAPYTYAWSSTLGAGDYSTNSAVFTILATAPVGSFSAEVVASDSASAKVTNSLNFSVVAPVQKYAITITAPVNGSVTTTPATEAAAGDTVTVNATPNGGYAVDTYNVVGADTTVIGTTSSFTMPAQAVTVTVTFKEATTPTGGLVISQYTETEAGTTPKGIEIWNASGADITFNAGDNLLEILVGVNGAAPAISGGIAVNSGTLTAGDVWVIGTADLTPDVVKAFTFNGDDAIVIQLGGVVHDVFGTPGVDPGAAWSGNGVSTMNQNIQLKEGITAGDVDGWTDPSERFETVSTTPSTDFTGFGVPPGPVGFSVSFDKTSGFKVDEGTSATITATAANGTAPYTYAWTTDLGATYRTISEGVLTILATAPVGSYSAEVVATDNTSAKVTNSLTFSVVAPTPAEGIVDFRFNEVPYLQVTAKDANLAVSDMALTAGTIETGVAGGAYITDPPCVEETSGWTATAQADAKALIFTITPAEGASMTIDAISFKAYATAAGPTAFGFDVGGGTATYAVDAPSAALVTVSQAVAGVVSETGAIQVKIQGWLNDSRVSSGAGIFRLDDVVIHGSVSTGPLEFSVSVNKFNGFTVNQGSADSITATAANGTAPYGYSWGTTLPSGFSSAGAVFSIQASAPVGNWSATVTATDDTAATAQKTVTFSVVGVNPGDPAVVISGSLSGTVGVQMNLSITVTNETANDWFIDLKDPDVLDDYSYGWAPPAFTLTPTKAGIYVLSMTAETGSGNYNKTVNLTVGGGVVNPPIPAITVVAGTGFSFTVPDAHTLARVEGASALSGSGWVWTTLANPADYTQDGSTITIKSSVGTKRMIRIWLN